MAVKSSLEDLIQAGAHFGHQSRRWNPKMSEYIHGVRDGVHIFDLIKTKECLDEALNFLSQSAKEGKKILILGTKKQARSKVEEVAKKAGVFYVNERWLGGTLTNFDQIKTSVRKLTDMKSKLEKGEYKVLVKKERLLIEREIARLERFFGGIAEIEDIPDVLVIIDIKREKSAVIEAEMKGVDTVAVVDSNCDPDRITYPIPMNDDATRSIDYVLELIGEAILDGKKPKVKNQKPKVKNQKPKVKKTRTKTVKKTRTKK